MTTADPEQQLVDLLAAILTSAQSAYQGLPQTEQFPESGSPLAGDDKGLSGFHLSHVVHQQLGLAGDQLHAMTNLLSAGSTHPYANYPLLRSALANASSALWILEPASRRERQARRLRLLIQEARYSNKFQAAAGLTGLDHVQHYTDIGVDLGFAVKDLKKAGYGEITDEVESKLNSEFSVAAAWQIVSGLTHGQQWAVLTISQKELTPSEVPGIQNVRLTVDTRSLVWVTYCAVLVLTRAATLFRSRGTNVMAQLSGLLPSVDLDDRPWRRGTAAGCGQCWQSAHGSHDAGGTRHPSAGVTGPGARR